jgi:hypothetical protein
MEPVVHPAGLGRVDQDGGRAGPAVAQAAEEVGGLQLHRDPLRPGTVDRGVADEEVPPAAVGHCHCPSLPGCRRLAYLPLKKGDEEGVELRERL